MTLDLIIKLKSNIKSLMKNYISLGEKNEIQCKKNNKKQV
jgi:hypothetical protein